MDRDGTQRIRGGVFWFLRLSVGAHAEWPKPIGQKKRRPARFATTLQQKDEPKTKVFGKKR